MQQTPDIARAAFLKTRDEIDQDHALYPTNQEWVVKIGDKDVKCRAVRNFSWCGYVELDGKIIDNDDDLDVHGGVTYHSPGVSIGFDCSHYNDVNFKMTFYNPKARYWSFPMVKAETERLARQIFSFSAPR